GGLREGICEPDHHCRSIRAQFPERSGQLVSGWDKDVDVLVIGTGAGGMAPAVFAAHRGARTLIIERSAQYGGTSATSGGGVWIPCSDSAREQGQEDTPEEAFTYIKALTGNTVADACIRAFVENGHVMKRA